MSCVFCFFNNANQKLLKRQCFGITDFSQKLELYKQLYLEEISKLVPAVRCGCEFSQRQLNNKKLLALTDDFLRDIQLHSSDFGKMFDVLILIYQHCKNGRMTEAILLAKQFNQSFCTGYSSKNSLGMCVPLFRARASSGYDTTDINQFFHLPMSKKANATEQRFSVHGNVMLYLARSIPIALHETGLTISEANLSVFLPKYSWVHEWGMYSFQNSIDVTINEALTPGFSIDYDNNRFTFSKRNLIIMMGDSILFQVLTFPVEHKSTPCEEYRLPQLFTKMLQHPPYLGVVYHSSKDSHLFSHTSKYSELDSNYCFFVPNCSGEYNKELLNCFHHVCIGECDSGVKMQDVSAALNQLGATLKIQNKEYNMSDYIMDKCEIERHLSAMEKIKLYGKSYYDTEEGCVELALFLKLIEKIQEIVNEPGKHGVVSLNRT